MGNAKINRMLNLQQYEKLSYNFTRVGGCQTPSCSQQRITEIPYTTYILFEYYNVEMDYTLAYQYIDICMMVSFPMKFEYTSKIVL